MIETVDKDARNMSKATIQNLYKALEVVQIRLMDQDVALQDIEFFKLDMCKKYLNSEMLEPRL